MSNQHATPPPKWIIDPACVPGAWVGEPWQFYAIKNPSYLNSVWAGTICNVAVIPSRIWYELIKPLLHGDISTFLVSLLRLPLMMLLFLIAGLKGDLKILRGVSIEMLREAKVLTEEESAKKLAAGNTVGIIEVAKL